MSDNARDEEQATCTAVAGTECVAFCFPDGSTTDVPVDVVARSRILSDGLASCCDGQAVAFPVPQDMMHSWLRRCGFYPFPASNLLTRVLCTLLCRAAACYDLLMVFVAENNHTWPGCSTSLLVHGDLGENGAEKPLRIYYVASDGVGRLLCAWIAT